MILERQEKDGVIKALYDSSNVIGSIYYSTTNELEIIFKSGTKYKYDGVSKSDYMRFEIAESQGTVFNTHIKKYPNVNMGKVDVDTLLTETSALKDAEEKAFIEAKRLELVKLLKNVTYSAEKMEVRLPNAKSPEKLEAFNVELRALKLQLDNFLILIPTK